MAKPATVSGREGGAVSYKGIVAALRAEIIQGKHAPGSRLPTCDDLQQRFSTTRMTVHRACRRLITTGYARSRAKIGTYVADFPPHLYRYGLVFPDLYAKSRYHEALRLAAKRLVGKGPRQFVVFNDVEVHADNEGFQSLSRDLAAKRLAGVLFPYFSDAMQASPIFEDGSTPLVRAGNYDAILPYCVALELHGPIRRALDLLERHNRRRVGLLTIAANKPDRLLRADRDLGRRGMRTNPYWSMSVDPSNLHWVRHAVHAILHGHEPEDRPDALIIDDDTLVRPALAALHELRVRVPQDLMVIGHWNFPLPTNGTDGVTLIGFDAGEVVARSIEIIDLVRRGAKAPTRIDVPARFADEIDSIHTSPASPVGAIDTLEDDR